MLTLLKKHDINTILEASKDDNIKHNIDDIIALVDDGETTSEEKNALRDYINKCVNNNNDVSNYYLYEYTPTIDIFKQVSEYRGYALIRLLMDAIYHLSNSYNDDTDENETKRRALLTILNGVKGVRDNQDTLTLINKFLDANQHLIEHNDYNYLKNAINNACNTTPRKYIVSVSNTPLSQLTSSYSLNYSSCYNLAFGEYRSSNIYLMRDYRVYIVKIFSYNDDNLAMIDNDTLKISNNVTSRFNYCIDGENVAVAKNYGDTSYYHANINDFIKLASEIITQVNNYTPLLINEPYERGITYADDFIGYQDLRENLRLTTSDCDIDDIGSNILANVNINWDINDSDMIIHNNHKCCHCCGTELYSDDDCYYCEDIDDYCCEDCCWWCDYDNCYYSNDTSYIRTPDGTYYRYDDCDMN